MASRGVDDVPHLDLLGLATASAFTDDTTIHADASAHVMGLNTLTKSPEPPQGSPIPPPIPAKVENLTQNVGAAVSFLTPPDPNFAPHNTSPFIPHAALGAGAGGGANPQPPDIAGKNVTVLSNPQPVATPQPQPVPGPAPAPIVNTPPPPPQPAPGPAPAPIVNTPPPPPPPQPAPGAAPIVATPQPQPAPPPHVAPVLPPIPQHVIDLTKDTKAVLQILKDIAIKTVADRKTDYEDKLKDMKAEFEKDIKSAEKSWYGAWGILAVSIAILVILFKVPMTRDEKAILPGLFLSAMALGASYKAYKANDKWGRRAYIGAALAIAVVALFVFKNMMPMQDVIAPVVLGVVAASAFMGIILSGWRGRAYVNNQYRGSQDSEEYVRDANDEAIPHPKKFFWGKIDGYQTQETEWGKGGESGKLHAFYHATKDERTKFESWFKWQLNLFTKDPNHVSKPGDKKLEDDLHLFYDAWKPSANKKLTQEERNSAKSASKNEFNRMMEENGYGYRRMTPMERQAIKHSNKQQADAKAQAAGYANAADQSKTERAAKKQARAKAGGAGAGPGLGLGLGGLGVGPVAAAGAGAGPGPAVVSLSPKVGRVGKKRAKAEQADKAKIAQLEAEINQLKAEKAAQLRSTTGNVSSLASSIISTGTIAGII